LRQLQALSVSSLPFENQLAFAFILMNGSLYSVDQHQTPGARLAFRSLPRWGVAAPGCAAAL